MPENTGNSLSLPMPGELIPPESLQGSLLHRQLTSIGQHFSSHPQALTREQFCLEMTLVARLAVCEKQYGPAVKAYEIVGKHLGAIDQKQDVHQHVHLHNPNQASPAEFARQSDEALRRIIAEAEEAREKRDQNV